MRTYGMILEKMEDVIPGWKDLIMVGSVGDVKRWLVENVHKHVRLYDPADLIRLITGKDLDIEPFLRYLDDKYSKLYGY